MDEHSFIRALHKKLDKRVFAWKINDNYAGGVPDAFYRFKESVEGQRPLWVEYKYLKALPKRETTVVRPDFSALQIKWLTEAHTSGEQAFGVVGVGKEVYIVGVDELRTGLLCSEVKERLISREDCARWILTKVVHTPPLVIG